MEHPTLTRLLRLVDDPAADPEEFKDALRAELQDTLERDPRRHPSPAFQVEPVVTADWPTEQPGRRFRSLAVAASIAAVVVGLAALASGTRDGTGPSTPVPPPSTTPTTLPATPTTLPTVESACATYAEFAPTFAELERVAELADSPATSSSVALAVLLDLGVAAESLRELRATLAAGDLISNSGALSLQVAAGGIAQARTEFEAGDTSAGARSVAFALRELNDLDDPPGAITLSGCGFP